YHFLEEPANKIVTQEDGQFLGFFFLAVIIAEILRLICKAFSKSWNGLDRLSCGCIIFAFAMILISFGPNYSVGHLSPYKIFYSIYLSFTGFFRAPARMAFISHWLLVVSTGVFCI